MADRYTDDSLVAITGFVTAVGGVISEIAKYDSSSADRYYSDLWSRREHEAEMERISARKALMRQRMADTHEEEMARIEAMERLKSQENELRKQLLETAERAYNRKFDYLEMLQKNVQDYFVPLRDKLLTLIEQTEYSCKASSCTGKEYDAGISRLGGLRASLDKCNRDYKELMFNLKVAASNARLELPSANLQGGMIEYVRQ
ncbi:MAG: hypothetical protein II837_03350 [Treponema sp.]|nr:hypothetical protein [Treponema sp.]